MPKLSLPCNYEKRSMPTLHKILDKVKANAKMSDFEPVIRLKVYGKMFISHITTAVIEGGVMLFCHPWFCDRPIFIGIIINHHYQFIVVQLRKTFTLLISKVTSHY